MPEEKKNTRMLSLEEFKAMKINPDVDKILGSINGGSLMDCHLQVYAATGIWMPELTPIFQKMDALLMTRQLPAALHK
jgi:hypothetical protein